MLLSVRLMLLELLSCSAEEPVPPRDATARMPQNDRAWLPILAAIEEGGDASLPFDADRAWGGWLPFVLVLPFSALQESTP